MTHVDVRLVQRCSEWVINSQRDQAALPQPKTILKRFLEANARKKEIWIDVRARKLIGEDVAGRDDSLATSLESNP